jgi:hypothetical protein
LISSSLSCCAMLSKCERARTKTAEY